MLVKELFEEEKISLSDLEEMFSGKSAYWNNAIHFVSDKWKSDIEDLTPKQVKWLSNILEDAVEKKIDG